MIAVEFEPVFEVWREKARGLLNAHVPPETILWNSGDQNLLWDAAPPLPGGQLRAPRNFVETARMVACHRQEHRWSLLYRVLYRLTHGEPHLLRIEIDPDTRELMNMEKQVARDLHQMHAFIRFRQAGDEYIAWYRPDHLIVKLAGPWFARRFSNMRWAILTPDSSAYWDTRELSYGPGVPRSEAPSGDALEDLWRAYYQSTFNPARVNLKQLRVHMPERRWSTMPETHVIPNLTRSASARERNMLSSRPVSGEDFIPADATLPVMAEAIHGCRGCDLWEHATQPVFGEGPATARIAFIGEQPGETEDRDGRPFRGPAGQLFDRALSDAGIDRRDVYVTSAVKHFRYEQRGKARIHKTASKAQVAACQPWLAREMEVLRPSVIVCMGGTAALSVVGRGVRLLEERGRILPHRLANGVLLTVHPAYLLRIPDEARRETEYRQFVADICLARKFAA